MGQVSIALSADYEISNLGQEATVATWRELYEVLTREKAPVR